MTQSSMSMLRNGSKKDHVEQLAIESKETTKQLEDRVFKTIEQMAPKFPGKYIISTADFYASVTYAPLFNLPQEILRKIASNVETTLFREIRDSFLVQIGPTGFIRKVCRSIRNSKQHISDIFFIEIHHDAEVGNVICHSPVGEIVEINNLVKETITNEKVVGDVLRNHISRLRKALDDQKEYNCFLIIRPEQLFEDTCRNNLDIMQIGLVFLPDETEITKESVSLFYRAAQISSFATLALLYEKERYYEKAVRQAVQGSLIKYGERKDIEEQVGILCELHDRERWNVPIVEEADPDISKSEGTDSWYKMSRVTLPSLMDIFTLTKGFEDYEVAALIRSCYLHLRETYWGLDLTPESISLQTFLVAPLDLAIDVAETTIGTVISQASDILDRKPVKLYRGIDVFNASNVQKNQIILDHMRNKNKLSINMKWSETLRDKLQAVEDPIKTLKDLLNFIIDNGKEKNISRLVIQRGNIHGDVHFGNLLVDSSVPEDPLIFSIDPKKIDVVRKTQELRVPQPLADSTGYKREPEQIKFDISYDIAKLLLSTSCYYGLVYRNGFVINISENVQRPIIDLAKNVRDEPKKLSDTGGISGSQIVRIDAPIPPDTWNYHIIASNKALKEFLSIYHEYYSSFQPNLFQRSINVGLMRLWIFTVRHAFSIIKSLFPIKAEGAMVMYLLASVFVTRGAAVIKDIIRNNLDAEESDLALRKIFLWEE